MLRLQLLTWVTMTQDPLRNSCNFRPHWPGWVSNHWPSVQACCLYLINCPHNHQCHMLFSLGIIPHFNFISWRDCGIPFHIHTEQQYNKIKIYLLGNVFL